ncbi:MAG: Rpn family recombination-promoting nuclease/putative transposase [Spirochaetes bacterium]|nr:Rpn family recombination-promoting nuclease/putative transposase [Spirochaetota bacterium]MBN2769641.1 Rpn family recombination-promoting nuclease/putative transposase [Spirochaetota bacterium]
MINIWLYQEKNRENLTLIVPIIFYNGRQRWKIVPFNDLFEDCDENWSQFVPDLKYLLTDVARYNDETIKNKLYKREFNRALALIFKYIGNESLLFEKLYDIMFQLKDYLDNEKDVQLIMSFLTYMMSFTNITPEYLMTITRQISEKGESVVMSTAMKLREEGKLEGIEEGIQKGMKEGVAKGKAEGKLEGKLETAQAMLLKGFSVQEIAEITGLSEKDINSLV